MGSDGGIKFAAWLGFAGVILAAVIAGVFGLLAARGDARSEGTAATTTSRPTPSAPAAPTTTPPVTQPGSADTASVRWQGTVTMQQSTSKQRDLDKSPPPSVEPGAGGDIQVWGVTNDGAPYGMLSTAHDSTATIAKWRGAGTSPGYGQCAEAAVAEGVVEVKVVTGMVLCVNTADGRTARLVATVDDKAYAITFDTIVWEPAA